MRRFVVLATLLALAIGGRAQGEDRPLAELLAEAWTKQRSGALDEARALFEDALARARDERQPLHESESLRGIAAIVTKQGDYPGAQARLDEALPLAEASGSRGEVGRVLNGLGSVAWYRHQFDQARALYERAIVELEAAGDDAGAANTLANLAMLVPGEEKGGVLDRGLRLAAKTNDPYVIGRLLQHRGDWRRAQGDFAGALESLLEAKLKFEESGHVEAQVTVLNSLGFLHRIHGRADRALEFQRQALKMARTTGDPHITVQSLAGVGNALRDLHRPDEAVAALEEGLSLATDAGLPTWQNTFREALAQAEVDRGRYARVLELLESPGERKSRDSIDGGFSGIKARALLGLGRLQDALAAANLAVEDARVLDTNQGVQASLAIRARCLLALGRPLEALRDGQESLAAIEVLRTRLVPDDFMRQGFGERTRETYDLVIGILHGLGRYGEALEAASQARARAFLDSLASGSRAALAKDARSARYVAAATLDDVRATARRLDSTVLVYYAGPKDVYAWGVPSEGPVVSAKLPASTSAIASLVEATQGEDASATTRGSSRALPTRAGGLLVLGDASAPFRRLYDVLVRPLRRSLPGKAGARLTIVPDGPLFRLPFGAMRDGSGRYLVERYVIHYGPAVGTFGLTARSNGGAGGRLLLVGDPRSFPATEDGPALQPLPGSRREMDGIARLLGPERVERLQGTDATESRLRARAHEAGSLHFSTHGVVRDDAALESFVALEPGLGTEEDDGRLTTSDVYGLDLHTDLVFLSACRTARGGVSSDGVVGLTRAFFHAGASSIVATLWDVVDEPAQRLVSDFYRARLAGDDKATALRTAQVRMLRALRGGRVTVQTAAGPVVLPEHPALWAPFVLLGEP